MPTKEKKRLQMNDWLKEEFERLDALCVENGFINGAKNLVQSWVQVGNEKGLKKWLKKKEFILFATQKGFIWLCQKCD